MFENYLPLILLAYFIVCLLYFGIIVKFESFSISIIKFIIVFLLPVIGFLLIIVFNASGRVIVKSDKEIKEFVAFTHKRNFIYHEEAVDFEQEINTIPLQDSLKFNDSKAKRSYLIYILKKNFSGHIYGLKKALKSGDSETAHYAAAALMEIKNQFENKIAFEKENYEKDSESIETVKKYAATLKDYLKSGIADSIDYYDFLNVYSILLDKLISIGVKNEQYFEDKISAAIIFGEYESALGCCRKFLTAFPESEKPYICYLKYFYAIKDYKAFNNAIKKIKAKSLSSAQKLESIISFWEGGRVCF
jgi:hypothetical protein